MDEAIIYISSSPEPDPLTLSDTISRTKARLGESAARGRRLGNAQTIVVDSDDDEGPRRFRSGSRKKSFIARGHTGPPRYRSAIHTPVARRSSPDFTDFDSDTDDTPPSQSTSGPAAAPAARGPAHFIPHPRSGGTLPLRQRPKVPIRHVARNRVPTRSSSLFLGNSDELDFDEWEDTWGTPQPSNTWLDDEMNVDDATQLQAFVAASATARAQPTLLSDQGYIAIAPELLSEAVGRVLEVFPDVDPDHLTALITKDAPMYGYGVVEHVINALFDDVKYPRVDRKGKGKRKLDDEENQSEMKKSKVDYADKSRPFAGGPHYEELALEQLRIDFPLIPRVYLKKMLTSFNRLYAPTYIFLSEKEEKRAAAAQQVPTTNSSGAPASTSTATPTTLPQWSTPTATTTQGTEHQGNHYLPALGHGASTSDSRDIPTTSSAMAPTNLPQGPGLSGPDLHTENQLRNAIAALRGPQPSASVLRAEKELMDMITSFRGTQPTGSSSNVVRRRHKTSFLDTQNTIAHSFPYNSPVVDTVLRQADEGFMAERDLAPSPFAPNPARFPHLLPGIPGPRPIIGPLYPYPGGSSLHMTPANSTTAHTGAGVLGTGASRPMPAPPTADTRQNVLKRLSSSFATVRTGAAFPGMGTGISQARPIPPTATPSWSNGSSTYEHWMQEMSDSDPLRYTPPTVAPTSSNGSSSYSQWMQEISESDPLRLTPYRPQATLHGARSSQMNSMQPMETPSSAGVHSFNTTTPLSYLEDFGFINIPSQIPSLYGLSAFNGAGSNARSSGPAPSDAGMHDHRELTRIIAESRGLLPGTPGSGPEPMPSTYLQPVAGPRAFRLPGAYRNRGLGTLPMTRRLPLPASQVFRLNEPLPGAPSATTSARSEPAASTSADLDYVPLATPFRPSPKGKSKLLHDEEFARELAWVQDYKAKKRQKQLELEAEADPGEQEDGTECQCCFSNFAVEKMVQCAEAHFFCKRCITAHTSTLLGARNVNINCIHTSGCALPIPETELVRVLPAKLLNLWERVKQKKELEAAGLEGWEECPFCDFGCVMEIPISEDKLFRCKNEDVCGAVSCRTCKKMDHLPKSCEEFEADQSLNGRHHVEEAMSRALMRNCPKCQKAFVKQSGCNHITCPHCRASSCYMCRQLIVPGDGHFTPMRDGSFRCTGHGPVEELHAREVEEARQKAIEAYKLEHPDVDEAQLNVEFPRPEPTNRVPQAWDLNMWAPADRFNDNRIRNAMMMQAARRAGNAPASSRPVERW